MKLNIKRESNWLCRKNYRGTFWPSRGSSWHSKFWPSIFLRVEPQLYKNVIENIDKRIFHPKFIFYLKFKKKVFVEKPLIFNLGREYLECSSINLNSSRVRAKFLSRRWNFSMLWMDAHWWDFRVLQVNFSPFRHYCYHANLPLESEHLLHCLQHQLSSSPSHFLKFHHHLWMDLIPAFICLLFSHQKSI